MNKDSDSKQLRQVVKYIRSQYSVEADYPWNSHDDAVYRHADNKKWFALTMLVRRDRLGPGAGDPGNGDLVYVINLKIDDPVLHDMVVHEAGIIPSYHMNKRHWITVLLDGTVQQEQVEELIDISYRATASRRRVSRSRAHKEWLVPANPKYYDVIGAFEKSDEIDWKQGAGIREGDTIYLYVAAPVSAILFKCRVLQTDIPYDYEDGALRIRALMKIKLIRRYAPDEFTWERLNDEFGIYAIRGPRGVPNSLSERLGSNIG